jgi:hypothetical protein
MKLERMEDAVLELLWSAWTELGVPGVERKHRRVALDPEPLIIFTPALASNDPRLIEQATLWCERHGEVITKTRLDGLQRRVPPAVASSFVSFAEPLRGAAALWKNAPEGHGRDFQVTRSGPLPFERPSLARLRMRSLAGAGARADILCELLGASNRWTSATDLEYLGYTRRSIARVLAELTSAHLTITRSAKGPASFRLRDPQAIATLIKADSLIWPDWVAVLALAWQLAELEKSSARSALVAPVKARDAWDELRRLSLASGVDEPPSPTGEAAWPALLHWGWSVLHRWPLELLAAT